MSVKKIKRYNVYFASGWFTPDQVDTYERCIELFDHCKKEYNIFFPKEASKDLQDKLHIPKTRKIIFNRNIRAIHDCDFVICSTESKDMGSLIEYGYALALNKPVIAINFHLGNSPINLMITESALATAKDIQELGSILGTIYRRGLDKKYFKRFLNIATAE